MPAVAPNTDPSTVVNRIADFRPRAEHLAALAAVVVDRRGVSAEAEVAIAVIDDDGVRVRVVGGPLPCRVGRRRSGPGGRPSSAPRERLSRAPGDGRSWRALVERCAPTTVAMAMRLRLLLSHTGARFFDVAKRRSRSKRGLAPDLFLDFVEVFGSRVLRSSYSSLCPDQEHLCRLVLSRPDISGELLVVGQPAVPVDGLAVGRWLRAVEPLSWEGACRWTSELGTPTLTVSPPRLATMVVLSGEARRRRDMAGSLPRLSEQAQHAGLRGLTAARLAFISAAVDDIDFDERVLSLVGATEVDELFVFLRARGEFFGRASQ